MLFFNSLFLFSLDVSKAHYLVDGLHSRCTSSLGLHSIFGRFTRGQYGNFAFLGHLRERAALDLEGQGFAFRQLLYLQREFRVEFNFVDSSRQNTLGDERIVGLSYINCFLT